MGTGIEGSGLDRRHAYLPAGESGLLERWPLGLLVDRSTSILEFSFLGEQSPLPRRQKQVH